MGRYSERYFDGEDLIGEDFSPDEIAEWFEDEKEASFKLRGGKRNFAYHEMHKLHGFEKLPARKFSRVLSFGGGNGAELLPILERLGQITILEPSQQFEPAVSAEYIAPGMDGSIPAPDCSFDLITCLSVLHHVPNVSAVIRELHRCTADGGFALISEPIVSMGDWRRPRPGLTSRERGIPLHLLRSFIERAGFRVISESKCNFGPINYIARKLNAQPYNSRSVVFLDAILCKLPFWTQSYHAQTFLEKIRPAGVYYVLTK